MESSGSSRNEIPASGAARQHLTFETGEYSGFRRLRTMPFGSSSRLQYKLKTLHLQELSVVHRAHRGKDPVEYTTTSFVPDDDRRAKRRFPLALDLRFKVIYRGKALAIGTGRTLDICSGGISFPHDAPLKPGAAVEMSVSWPALLDGVCTMQLNLSGRALRSNGQITVCQIGKYEFRTVGRRAAIAAAAAGISAPQNVRAFQATGSYATA